MALRPATAVAVDASAWLVVQVSTGYLVHRLPDRVLDHDRALWQERAFEGGGDLYVRGLRIKSWKRFLPEAGDVFPGGFDKSRLGGRSTDQLRRHLRETRRAELGHWLALSALPLFLLWNPPLLWAANGAYAVAVNGPCIASQRYNRIRLARVLLRRG